MADVNNELKELKNRVLALELLLQATLRKLSASEKEALSSELEKVKEDYKHDGGIMHEALELSAYHIHNTI